MTVTASKQNAYAALIYGGQNVPKQNAYAVMLEPVETVSKQNAYAVLLPARIRRPQPFVYRR